MPSSIEQRNSFQRQRAKVPVKFRRAHRSLKPCVFPVFANLEMSMNDDDTMRSSHERFDVVYGSTSILRTKIMTVCA